MSWTDPDPTLFETGDVFTEGNFKTHVLDNLLALAHPLEAPTTADLDVVSSAAETTLYSVTVLGNTLGTVGSVLAELYGDTLYNNNIADTMTLRVKFGGSTQLQGAAFPLGTLDAARQPWYLRIVVANKGATNSQVLYASLDGRPGNVTTPVVGLGRWDTRSVGAMISTSAIDTTVDQSLLVSVQWSVSSANNSWRRRWARTLIGQH